jgi:hypothetical protein
MQAYARTGTEPRTAATVNSGTTIDGPTQVADAGHRSSTRLPGGVNAALAVLALIGAVLMAVEVAGVYQPQPLEREDMWLGVGFYAAVAVVCAWFAFGAQCKGHAR